KAIEVPSPSSEIPNEEGVLDLEEAKTAQAKEIASLKKRVKKLEQKRKSRTSGLKRLRKGTMNEEDMFRVNDLDVDEVVVDVSASVDIEHSVKVVKKEVSTADPVTTADEVVTTTDIQVITIATTPQISKDELTLAQTLIEIKAAKPKAIITAAITVTAASTRSKEKGIIMQEPFETPSPKLIISSQKPSQAKDKVKGKMMLAELEEEERLARLKEEETDITLVLFNNTMKWIEAFVHMDLELVKGSDKAVEGNEKAEEGSSKRAGSNLEQEDAKRQRLEEENESAELKRCLEIIPKDDDDVTIEATPLSSKSLTIVDYKIYKEGKKSYFKIIRADNNS
nr:hypothetical protein [Tanacetum cinerariifolium]